MKTSDLGEKVRDVKLEYALYLKSGDMVAEAFELAHTPSSTESRLDWLGRARQLHKEMIDFLAFQPKGPYDADMLDATNEFKKVIDLLNSKWVERGF